MLTIGNCSLEEDARQLYFVVWNYIVSTFPGCQMPAAWWSNNSGILHYKKTSYLLLQSKQNKKFWIFMLCKSTFFTSLFPYMCVKLNCSFKHLMLLQNATKYVNSNNVWHGWWMKPFSQYLSFCFPWFLNARYHVFAFCYGYSLVSFRYVICMWFR